MSNLSSSRKKIIFITAYYDAFIRNFYQKNQELANSPYQEQLQALTGSFFGDSDIYSQGIKKCGWNAKDIIYNCSELQQKWLEENGITQRSLLEILIEQIKKEKPDVVYIHNFLLATESFINQIRPHTRLIVGQIASAVPVNSNPSLLDIIFTSFPHFVQKFREMGVITYYQPLAFDQRAWKKLQSLEISKDIPVSFVGGLSRAHIKGVQLLDYISSKVKVDIFGYGAEILPENALLRKYHHGEVWGLEMFATLARSKITINRHIDSAEQYANNMRLFEATGCGALLITEERENLHELFEINKEIITYTSPEDAVEKIQYYLTHPKEAEKIAQAGQVRTFKDHSFNSRMEQTAEILEHHLKRLDGDLLNNLEDAPSSGYVETMQDQVSEKMIMPWLDTQLPKYQRKLTNKELDLMYNENQIVLPYKAIQLSLDGVLKHGDKLLEISCASGYYAEVIPYLTGKRIDYTGVDYSSALIKMAKSYYPANNFYQADGADLPFKDHLFDVVISGGYLQYVPNYKNHIEENIRVSKKIIVLHRIPVCKLRSTYMQKKIAYGVEMVEFCFNINELISLFINNGCEFIKGVELSTDIKSDQYQQTWVFKKKII